MPLKRGQIGLLCVASCFMCWGLVPIYYRSLSEVSALEIVAHRIIWAFLLLAVCLAPKLWRGAARDLLAKPRTLGVFVITSALICANWLIFTWAATHGHVLETSLGYFINPLLNILLGVVVLRERLRRAQLLAVALAAAGVFIMILWYGQIPWISLSLALSFGTYGLLRKQVPADPFLCVLAEVTVVLPFAAAYLAYLWARGESAFGQGDFALDLQLWFAGPLTIFPLALFGAGVTRVRLTTVGFMQYITPTMSFLLAVFAFGEPFSTARLTTFLFIWAALALVTVDSLHTQRNRNRPLSPDALPQEN